MNNISYLDIGFLTLFLAWFIALFSIIIVISNKKNRISVGKHASIFIFICLLISIISLTSGFLLNNFANQYIWSHSSTSLDILYKITALWSGMDGSLLFWVFLISCSGFYLASNRKYQPASLEWSLPVINFSILFFLTLLVFFTNPFRYIQTEFIPPDGNGLNPLLQNPYMAIHPPLLYIGFTAFTVPFALCLNALIKNELSNDWIKVVKNWTLFAWAALTAGIVLGGFWAYIELGWGGYWAWDPVENSSFLPWLTGTAFMHSIMVQEKRSLLKIWNVILIILTYLLTIFGTFLTRSGIVKSVHAFAETDIGWVFLLYITLVIVFSSIIIIKRKNNLKTKKQTINFLSRETFFLLNNLILLSICFSTLWGVLFPVISETITGSRQTVGIPYFNTINVPLFLLLLVIMGIGQLISWKQSNLTKLKRTFLVPFSFSFILCVLFYIYFTNFYVSLAYALSSFVLLSLIGELARNIKKHDSFISLLRKQGRRYSAFLAHIGFCIIVISITASSAFKIEEEFALGYKEEFQINGLRLSLDDSKEITTPSYQALEASVSLYNNKKLSTLKPQIRNYFNSQENTSEVAIYTTLTKDIYIVLAGSSPTGDKLTFKIFINPLQVWLWIGSILIIIAILIILISQKLNYLSKQIL